MKISAVFTIALLLTTLAFGADFSYTSTSKATGGSMAAVAGGALPPSTKYYYQGQKMKVDRGDGAEIIDFDAKTITSINNRSKSYLVRNFSEVQAPANQAGVIAKIDIKETGQKKTVNGYSASELMLTMDVDSPQTGQMGRMQMEMDLWISPDVPGASELRAFYQKNAANFPWAAMAGGGNQSMTAGIADMQRKISEMNGVPVEQVVKIRMAGGAGAPARPQMNAAQQAQMADAMAKLKALQAQGGPAAAAAAQAMSRMGNIPGATGAAPAGGGNSLMEITMDSSDFSSSSIPDSVFAIPAGYQKQ
jgi:hypothetical protein